MSLLLHTKWPEKINKGWIDAIEKHLPSFNLQIWPDVKDPDAVQYALIWNDGIQDLPNYKNIKAFFSLGAGVDHLIHDPYIASTTLPIYRITDNYLRDGMKEYVIYHIIKHHRFFDIYRENKDKKIWKRFGQPNSFDRHIGILGLGFLGTYVGEALHHIGFNVSGWSQSRKTHPHIKSYAGEDEFDNFLKENTIFVCLLPLTDKTKGILNRHNFSKMPQGSYVINVARGGHLIEGDLLEMVDNNHLAGATLDVFQKEPLDDNHPFWDHPKIDITPHMASLTTPDSAISIISKKIELIEKGQTVPSDINPKAGY